MTIMQDLIQSSSFTVTTPDLRTHIQTMITLLQEPVLATYPCATDAIRDLRQVLCITQTPPNIKCEQYKCVATISEKRLVTGRETKHSFRIFTNEIIKSYLKILPQDRSVVAQTARFVF